MRFIIGIGSYDYLQCRLAGLRLRRADSAVPVCRPAGTGPGKLKVQSKSEGSLLETFSLPMKGSVFLF